MAMLLGMAQLLMWEIVRRATLAHSVIIYHTDCVSLNNPSKYFMIGTWTVWWGKWEVEIMFGKLHGKATFYNR